MEGDPVYSKPLRVRSVHVAGNKRTHRSVIDDELRGAREGRNVDQVVTGLMEALHTLRKSECFEAVEIFCDVPRGVRPPKNANTEYTDVTVTVKEKRIVTAKAETYVSGTGSDGGVEMTCSLNNPAGYTEKVNISASYGTKNSAATRVEVVKPKFRGLPFTLDVNATQDTSSKVIYSSYDEHSKGVEANLRHEENRHQFGIGTVWRDIIPARGDKNEFAYAASGLIIAQARPSLKNSLRYSFTNDHRDDPHGPTRGNLFNLQTEYAGFGGDVNFLKSQLKLQQFIPVANPYFRDMVVGISFHAGLLCPLGHFFSGGAEDGKAPTAERAPVGGSSSISDRFWLGGPLTLRGFNHKGAGPRTSPNLPGAKGGDSLGGDMTWGLGYTVLLPMPHSTLHKAGMRVQLYANAGNLCAWETSMRTLLYGARASIGAGLVFPTPLGRVEANYSYVLRANSRDDTKGFQLGLGFDFM